MTVRLRAHHLLCVLTYVGRGYSPAFTANMTRIAGRLAAGERIDIVEGPDDICAPLLDGDDPHCHRSSVIERDHAARHELARALGLEVATGARLILDADRLSRMRAAFGAGQTRTACVGCEWFSLCGSIAATGFEATVLAGHRDLPDRQGA